MPWSPTQLSEDLQNQMTILVGSAIRLLGGEFGVFVVSNEAFDPQSSEEYTVYRLNEAVLPLLLAHAQEGLQPNSMHPLIVAAVSPALAAQFLHANKAAGYVSNESGEEPHLFERCSLFVYDTAGELGELHFLRPEGVRSCFEGSDAHDGGTYGTLRLFIAQCATGLRFALRSQSLAKEQGRFAAIFQYSAEGILTVDSALRIIDFNPAMERLTGWRESEVLGRFYFEVLRPKDWQGNDLGLEDSPILQAFAGRVVVNREMIISARDGQRINACVTASCVRSARGEPMNGILNVRDVTRERQQEEQRSTFISVISHELQTPIAIIKGYASTLARTNAMLDPEALRLRLIAVEEEADRLNKLVGNLLYASRIQAGGLLMEVVPLDLPPLIESVVRRFQAKHVAVPLMGTRGQHVETPLVGVRGDPPMAGTRAEHVETPLVGVKGTVGPGQHVETPLVGVGGDVTVTLDLLPNLPTVMADRDRIEEVL